MSCDEVISVVDGMSAPPQCRRHGRDTSAVASRGHRGAPLGADIAQERLELQGQPYQVATLTNEGGRLERRRRRCSHAPRFYLSHCTSPPCRHHDPRMAPALSREGSEKRSTSGWMKWDLNSTRFATDRG